MLEMLGGILGLLGAATSLVAFFQAQSDRKAAADDRAFVEEMRLRQGVAQAEHEAYERWVAGRLHALRPFGLAEVKPDEYAWAVRAIKAGLFEWGPQARGRSITFPKGDPPIEPPPAPPPPFERYPGRR